MSVTSQSTLGTKSTTRVMYAEKTIAREAKAKEASCCDDRIIVTGAVIRHNTCRKEKDGNRERETEKTKEHEQRKTKGLK